MIAKIIVFNWKMNPDSIDEAEKILRFTMAIANGKEVVLAPPFVYLEKFHEEIINKKADNILLCAQNVSHVEKRAMTGDVSAKMLASLDVKYAIVGHSERRYELNENDDLINKKIKILQNSGITPILCVGEKTKSEVEEAKEFIKKQLELDLNGVDMENIVIAYEPVWSIGGDKETDESRSAEIIKFIKTALNSIFHIPDSIVIYGGSVNCKNIKEFSKYENIDGFLVGSASLREEGVKCIISNT